MKQLFTILLSLSLLLVANFASAQTSVYFCPRTGAVGYTVNTYNPEVAAYNMCVNYGGVSPYRVLTNYNSGYGAIVFGTNAYGARVIGAAAGYSSQYAANQVAWNACIANGGYNVYVAAQWYDN